MGLLDERTDNRNDVVAEALAAARKADEMRGAAIKELLAQQEQILRDLKTLGYSENPRSSPNGTTHRAPQTGERNPTKRFKDLTLAEVGRILLEENDVLHGKEIETLAKVGGFLGGTGKFQNYLPVALKRAGGFENIGGNPWRINASIPAQRQERK